MGGGTITIWTHKVYLANPCCPKYARFCSLNNFKIVKNEIKLPIKCTVLNRTEESLMTNY